MKRLGVIRLLRENPAIERFGLFKPARLVVLQGQVKELGSHHVHGCSSAHQHRHIVR